MMSGIKKIFILFALIFIPAVRTDPNIFYSDFDDYVDEDLVPTNHSLPMNSTGKPSSLSARSKALSTQYISLSQINTSKSTIFFKKLLTHVTSRKSPTTTTSRQIPQTAGPVTPYMLVSYLVDQFNHYRNIDILSRIKQCDSKMKLHDMCELYSFDNHTYSLIRELSVEFQTLNHLYDTLIDRTTVRKLSNFCSTGQWCLGNLTDNDIHFTVDVLRQRGRSFCSLEKCSSRLLAYTTACPSITAKNISAPTLKLLPMLCALYTEQENWSTTKCINGIVYLLHILYAFWPQLENCHRAITSGSDGCTPECLAFDSILHTVESQCNVGISILSRVPTLAWYRLINLKQRCRHESIGTKPPLISSVKSLISSSLFWYQLHQRPVYATLFIIVIISIVISFSLCLYVMSKNDSDSNTRRFDNDYEYTRLHDATFELGSSTEISNGHSSSHRLINESQFDSNGNHRLSEHQRLLYAES